MGRSTVRMPPLQGLVAFEASLRLGSMTLAGDELGLTQSAISHRIRALEGFLGVELLERLNPGLRATEAGALLADEVAALLGSLAGMKRRIHSPPGGRTFRLGLGTPLLSWWLSPRLPALRATFPDLLVEVVTWDSAAQAAQRDVDLAVHWAPRADVGGRHRERPFPDERIFPVAAPAILKGRAAARRWTSLPLLAKGRRGEETGREWSWAAWLGAPPAVEGMRFRDIGSSLQAAVDGNGVALGRSLLVADALAQGRLVRLVPADEMRACSRVQVARWRDPYDTTAERMAAWLVDHAARALAADGLEPAVRSMGREGPHPSRVRARPGSACATADPSDRRAAGKR